MPPALQGLLGRAGPRQVVLAWGLLLLVAVVGLAALASALRGPVHGPAAPRTELPAAQPAPAPVPALVDTLATSDGGLRFGALAGRSAREPVGAHRASDLAWLFGALVSGGRSAEAWALLTPEAQRATSVEAFGAQLHSTYLLRGSDDAPWHVPGTDSYIFSVSDHEEPISLKGELRVELAMAGGQWRVSDFKLRTR